MGKQISVYGGTGFIGSRFCEMFPDKVALIERDVRRPKTNDILYFISTIHNYNVFDDPHLDINTNLNVLIDTLEACRSTHPKDTVFNFISSWFVYGKIEELPATESTACNPKGFYSITKRAAEQLIISYCETFDLKYRILRLCNVYGPSDDKASKKRNALQFLTGEIMDNRDINLYDDGKNIRDLLYVDDVCRAIDLVISKAPKNDIYNIGSGVPHNFKEMMQYVKKKANSNSFFHSVEPPHFHKVVQVQDMFLDISKLKALEFQPELTIWDGLDKIMKSTQKEKDK